MPLLSNETTIESVLLILRFPKSSKVPKSVQRSVIESGSPSGSVYPWSNSLIFKEYGSPACASGRVVCTPLKTGALFGGAPIVPSLLKSILKLDSVW